MAKIEGSIDDEGEAAVLGSNAGTGPGVKGTSVGTAVRGESDRWVGVFGQTDSTSGGAGVWGQSKTAAGVRGVSTAPGAGGVEGRNDTDDNPGPGVRGRSRGTGVWGESSAWVGVFGLSESETGGSGVWGEHKGAGVGVKAVSQDGWGLAAYSASGEAIHAETRSLTTAAVAAMNFAPGATGAALFAHKAGAEGHAGFFEGRVWISGDLGVGGDIQLANADVAENFDVASLADVQPGAVVRLSDGGAVAVCDEDYDTRVAGVVSGAGAYRPGVLLDSRRSGRRRPVALFGKVFCQVDATNTPIAVGDLLTSSSLPGFAMKAVDRDRLPGAVLGKALAPLRGGRRLIPILVALG